MSFYLIWKVRKFAEGTLSIIEELPISEEELEEIKAHYEQRVKRLSRRRNR